jgi:hypothetical protein
MTAFHFASVPSFWAAAREQGIRRSPLRVEWKHNNRSDCIRTARSHGTCWKELPIATKRNTYAKRQREQDKKQRADSKRAKREHKKEFVKQPPLPEGMPHPEEQSIQSHSD